MTVFGREPAAWIAFLSVLIQTLGAFVFHFSDGVQGGLTAVVTAAFGLWTAFHVASDKVLPAILGLAQAVIALVLAFGVDFSADKQALVMSLITAAVGLFVRTQVTAPVAASVGRG